jgi:hypothetical protein
MNEKKKALLKGILDAKSDGNLISEQLLSMVSLPAWIVDDPELTKQAELFVLAGRAVNSRIHEILN